MLGNFGIAALILFPLLGATFLGASFTCTSYFCRFKARHRVAHLGYVSLILSHLTLLIFAYQQLHVGLVLSDGRSQPIDGLGVVEHVRA